MYCHVEERATLWVKLAWMETLFQPVLHHWCNKGCGMFYPICEIEHIKDPLLLNEKSSPCNGSSGFTFSLSE